MFCFFVHYPRERERHFPKTCWLHLMRLINKNFEQTPECHVLLYWVLLNTHFSVSHLLDVLFEAIREEAALGQNEIHVYCTFIAS